MGRYSTASVLRAGMKNSGTSPERTGRPELPVLTALAALERLGETDDGDAAALFAATAAAAVAAALGIALRGAPDMYRSRTGSIRTLI
jgi:hypothetical protein